MKLRVATAWLALLTFSSCQIPARNAKPEASDGGFSIEREVELTSNIARQIRDTVPLVNDPVLLAYINDLGQRVVAITEPQPFVYRFNLIQEDSLNAFTIGGGYVYLNTEVLAQAGDVTELMGVIAHEIAHVNKRHIVKRSEGQGLVNLLNLAALAAAALAGDPTALVLAQGVNVALQLKNSRAAESEADREGIAYLRRSGYDPEGMIRFFQRILSTQRPGGDIPAYLYTHPELRQRIVSARTEIRRTDPAIRPESEAWRVTQDDKTPSPNSAVENQRLTKMQARLARFLQPVAGGSGLQAQPVFDRSITDPAVAEARELIAAERPEEASQLLADASVREPNDPRIPLLRADIEQAKDDWSAATVYLEQAFAIDPWGPLVQYRLGEAYARLGNRTRAAFYLEQAAFSYRPGSAGRLRAEFELRRLTLPMLTDSGFKSGSRRSLAKQISVEEGELVVWLGRVRGVFVPNRPVLTLQWRDPAKELQREDQAYMGPRGEFTSVFRTKGLQAGTWTLQILSDDQLVDTLRFEILSTDGRGH